MTKMTKRLFCVLLTALIVLPLLFSCFLQVGAQTEQRTYDGVNIVHHEGGYDHNQRTMVVHRYDFSVSRLSYYASDYALAISDRTTMLVTDGVLRCKEGSAFSFGSAVCLGDDYGLEKGYLKFDLCLVGGNVTLGLRTSRTVVNPEEGRGIWITFDGSGQLTVKDFLTGTEAQIPFDVSLEQAKTFYVKENRDELILLCEDREILRIGWKKGWLGFFDADGKQIAETNESQLDVTGYWELYLNQLDGYVDNIEFSSVEVDDSLPGSSQKRLIDYSTWSAVDDLGRTTATATEAGEANPNRYVGLFYFLCWVGAGVHVQDNTKLYLELGLKGFKQYFSEKRAGEAYWAEPYFGYYLNTDAWVYRKHAYMLEAAGVDFIFLDISNAETFINGHMTLFDTWLQIRKEGGETPQIVFFTGDNSKTFESHMETLFTTVYSDENWDKYKELFFEWEGKPLVFGNKSGLSPVLLRKIENKFTIRGSWAWVDQDGYWPWMQEYLENDGTYQLVNGGWGRNKNGKYEALAVCMGHHPTTNKGRSYVNGKQPASSVRQDLGFSLTQDAAQGKGFAFSFEAMQSLVREQVAKDDPFVMMLTGWNEWIAGCFYKDNQSIFINARTNFEYVDQFNCQYSRDGEPMRNVNGDGIGDNFYYQMTDYIRRFKGIAETPVADHQSTVDIYDKTTWDKIGLCYMDSVGDTELRNSRSYDIDYGYINNTGRNDFDYAKVSQDSQYFYFMVECRNRIVVDDGTNWMNLFLDVDGNRLNGWGGFDYVLNRSRDSYVVTLDRISDDGTLQTVGGGYYCIDGTYMAIRVAKSLLGIEENCTQLYFKWADNSVDVGGDLMAFMDTGDTAPNDRYNFDYRCDTVALYDTSYRLPTFAKGEIAATGNGGVRVDMYPDTTVKGEILERLVDTIFSFDDLPAGKYLNATSVADYFEFVGGSTTSVAQILEGKGNNYVRQTGYTDLRTWADVTGTYSVSIDLRPVDYGNSAVYIRGEMPGTLRKYNPAHSAAANKEIIQCFNYFEWDWYAENGGSLGGSSISGSGLGVFPQKDGLEIRIKRYTQDGLTVASAVKTIAFPDGFSVDKNDFYTLRFEDNGEEIRLYLNGTLFAFVKLENPGVVYESDQTGQKYYGKATLYDAAGKQLMAIENTRLNASGSQIAITTRSQTIEYDNLKISYQEEYDSIGSALKKEVLPADGTPTYMPDMRLLTALDMGRGAEADTTETVAHETGDITDTQQSQTTDETEKPSGCQGCGSALSLEGLLAVVCLGVGVIFCRRWTHKKDIV